MAINNITALKDNDDFDPSENDKELMRMFAEVDKEERLRDARKRGRNAPPEKIAPRNREERRLAKRQQRRKGR